MMRMKYLFRLLVLFSILILCIRAESTSPGTLVLVGGTIYPSPTEPPVSNGIIVIQSGKIVSIGKKENVRTPQDATVLNCEGMFITAAYQNSHVHFTESKWEKAVDQPASKLTAQLQEMFTRYGFTTVVDTGSDLANTVALRTRIESGEVKGPRILTAGGPQYPVNGIPFYLKDLPPEILASLKTPATPEEAASIARARLSGGADIIKLFTGSWVERGKVLPMDPKIASAAAAVAHQDGKLVFAHASNIQGLEVALQAKVDVLAHALDDDRGWNESHIERMKANKMSMIPTLKLFSGAPYTKYIQKEVGDYSRAGGQILFGTDVGFMTDYNPTLEYELMGGSGLTWQQILASLTSAQAERFGESKLRGRIAPEMNADLVVLSADPAANVKSFSSVRYTLRAGEVIYGQ